MEKKYIISETSLELFSQWLQNRDYSRVFILVDENSLFYCLPILLKEVRSLKNSHIIRISCGEGAKVISSCEYIWSELLENKADRKSLIINLGGGVLTDLGGFASSVFKRGVHFVNIPTTLIGMVDAATGGKTGVNFQFVKNQIGVFATAELVVVYKKFLSTLPQYQLVSGFAEMLKYGLILDQNLWKSLCTLDTENLIDIDLKLIERCLALKDSVVQKDYYEENYRKILNFGHTIGHALETYSFGGMELSHGEAVAHGMLVECILSNQMGLLAENVLDEVKSVIGKKYSKPDLHTSDFGKLYEIMSFDKKNQNTVVNFTLLKSIGETQIDNFISRKEIFKSLEEFSKS